MRHIWHHIPDCTAYREVNSNLEAQDVTEDLAALAAMSGAAYVCMVGVTFQLALLVTHGWTILLWTDSTICYWYSSRCTMLHQVRLFSNMQ